MHEFYWPVALVFISTINKLTALVIWNSVQWQTINMKTEWRRLSSGLLQSGRNWPTFQRCAYSIIREIAACFNSETTNGFWSNLVLQVYNKCCWANFILFHIGTIITSSLPDVQTELLLFPQACSSYKLARLKHRPLRLYITTVSLYNEISLWLIIIKNNE